MDEHDYAAESGSTVIREIPERELTECLPIGAAAVLFFTPLCGTCKLAEKMLGIAQAAGVGMPISKLNINYAPRLREAWRIASVPCLVLLRNGQPVDRTYAVQGVDYLYAWLKRSREAPGRNP